MFNQYSFISVAVGIIIIAGLILLTRNPKWNDYLAFGAVVAGFIAAWVILHPVQTPLIISAQSVQDKIGAGQPVLLEFQSPY